MKIFLIIIEASVRGFFKEKLNILFSTSVEALVRGIFKEFTSLKRRQ